MFAKRRQAEPVAVVVTNAQPDQPTQDTLKCPGIDSERVGKIRPGPGAFPELICEAQLRGHVEQLRVLSAESCLQQRRRRVLWMLSLYHHREISSARSSKDWGIVRPSALAVVRLITNSNLVGCSMGRSAGFAPLRILSTKMAARRFKSRVFAP